jgi:ATP-dependent DNA ligase
MLCRTLDVVPDDERYLSSEKLDGWRALAAVVADGVALRSREGHPVTAVPYINEALQALAPVGTILDGELVDRARPRQLRRTKSILVSPDAHVWTPADPPVTYAVFDLLFLAGRDLRDRPLHERLQLLAALFDSDTARALTTLPAGAPLLLHVEHRPSTATFVEEVLGRGEEGVMLKLRDSLYVHGSRTAGWWRYKPQETLDAECTGVARANGRTAGPISSLTFRLDGGAGGHVSSGLSEAERAHITAHPDEYVGHVIELAHHGVEASGALRHPVYRGVRDPRDKAPTPRSSRKTTRRAPSETVMASVAAGGKRKQRNYEAMGDAKLRASINSLRAKEGDAYERCLERGSGDPAADLTAALKAADKRGLAV